MTSNERCECGRMGGAQPCDATLEDGVAIVEYMPVHLRASHETAGNGGTYPDNGARRYRCHPDCAELQAEADPEWSAIVRRTAVRGGMATC